MRSHLDATTVTQVDDDIDTLFAELVYLDPDLDALIAEVEAALSSASSAQAAPPGASAPGGADGAPSGSRSADRWGRRVPCRWRGPSHPVRAMQRSPPGNRPVRATRV